LTLESPSVAAVPVRDLWDDLLPFVPHEKPPGNTYMLRLVAYDIADPKRLHRVAMICENFGVRVQYSLFECWLEDDDFERLWAKLQTAFKPDEDRLVAYVLDAAAVRRRLKAGNSMVLTEKKGCYLI
jgi:CRISPR-associated protein Cas2